MELSWGCQHYGSGAMDFHDKPSAGDVRLCRGKMLHSYTSVVAKQVWKEEAR